MFELGAPHTTRQLIDSLAEQRREIAAFFASISAEEFLAAQGKHWSPAEHLRHLVKSVRPVAMALRVPKPVLLLRFGFSTRGSRSFDAIVEAYRAELDRGGGAGRFAPSASGSRAPGATRKGEILDRWNEAGQRLGDGAERWSERALDRCRLPHPLLGLLTVREILCFTLYHNAHHARRVAERRVIIGGEAP